MNGEGSKLTVAKIEELFHLPRAMCRDTKAGARERRKRENMCVLRERE